MDCWQRAGAAAELPLRGTADRPLGLPSSAAAAHGTGSDARAVGPPVTSMRHRISAFVQRSGGGKSTPTRSQWPPSCTYRADCGLQRCCRQPGSGGRAAFERHNRIGHDSFAECSVGHSIGKEHRPPRGNLCYMYALRAARRLRGVPAGTARRRNAAFEAGGRARHWECRAAQSARRIVHAGPSLGHPHRLRGRQCLSTCACEVPPRRICHMAPLGGRTARSRILAP